MVRFGEFAFESASGRLWRGDAEIRLTPKAAAEPMYYMLRVRLGGMSTCASRAALTQMQANAEQPQQAVPPQAMPEETPPEQEGPDETDLASLLQAIQAGSTSGTTSA